MQNINQCIITITRNCNLRCSFCYAKQAGYLADEFIGFTSLMKLIDFCSDARVNFVVFTGGEPLLYPEITEALRYIKTRPHKMKSAIPTNGILLSDYEFCRNVIMSGLDYLDISMKGRDSQEWLKVSGQDGFSAQMSAIKNLSSFGADFTCSMVITHENVETFCDTVKQAHASGGRKFSFTFIIDNSDGSDYGIKYLESHNPVELVRKFTSQIDCLEEITSGEWWIEYSFPECIYTEEQLQKLRGHLASPCHVHTGGSLTIDAKMRLIPCSMIFRKVLGEFGEDFSSPSDLADLMNSESYGQIMSSLQGFPSHECESCGHKSSCLGGCPILWKHYSYEDLRAFMQKNYSWK